MLQEQANRARLPEITERDIEEAASLWELDLDEERREVLRCMRSVDIRACPGSGKTTLLVAKLGVLAAKWPYGRRGICVLSHTNAAREEVERQLARSPSLQMLTSYPHYVGTVQTFFHRYLAIPAAIERFGLRPAVVENSAYELEARREFASGSGRGGIYETAANWVRIQVCNDPRYEDVYDYVGRYLEYQDAELHLPPLGSSNRRISHDSTTGMQLAAFKERMAGTGCFRYQDMVALAAWYAGRHPGVAALLQERFPLVFFDEMQDTVAEQADMIDDLLGASSTVQRIGDDRQAIFGSVSEKRKGADFPRGTHLTVRKSFRLSPSIALLAQPVCSEPEELVGDASKGACQHTLYLFSRTGASKVLPAFCRLVISEIASGLTEKEVKAVGAIQKHKQDSDHFPGTLGHYWPHFVDPRTKEHQRQINLRGYIDQASSKIAETRSTSEARRALLASCVRMLRLQGVQGEPGTLTQERVVHRLRDESPESLGQLNTQLAAACIAVARGRRLDSVAFGADLLSALSPLSSGPWGCAVQDFVNSQDVPVTSPGTPDRADGVAQNVFSYSDNSGRVAVKVDTIHSVKGQTLQALLLLETYNHEFDLQKLLVDGYLRGSPSASSPSKRRIRQLRLAYVAMTRPRYLLCLAMLDEHVIDSDRLALAELGWTIKSVG